MTRPVLVLGPSLGTSAATLWGDCARLLEPDLDVVAWDLPGHGSDRTGPHRTRGPLSMVDLAARVLDQVSARSEGPFHYAGNSVGGAVGLQLLLDVPDRVASAVLLCTGARLGTAQSWQERTDRVLRSGTASVVEESAGRWFGARFLDREPARASALLHALADTDDDGYAAVCGALATFDVRDRLGEVASPVLAVAGAEDVATPPESLREIADGVRDGRLVVLDGVGHLAPAEAPEAVADLVRRQVRSTTVGGAA
ncbi:alpha/beta fold hydrolase [Nocardioides dongkuii]|uniref:alpha/beta fold hydrolase n=1 Tax=Nocardioides dongkuii TaxID=2760089 RepID=UPI0015FACE3F|nr:alpha/beta fold hydrolase [Nocardioides dongkuii]